MFGDRFKIPAAGGIGREEFRGAAVVLDPLRAGLAVVPVAADDQCVGSGSSQGFTERPPQHPRASDHDCGPSFQSEQSFEISLGSHQPPHVCCGENRLAAVSANESYMTLPAYSMLCRATSHNDRCTPDRF